MSLTEYLLDLRQAIDESIAKVEALLDGPTTNVDTHLQQLERGKE